jgi:hypothetical protein
MTQSVGGHLPLSAQSLQKYFIEQTSDSVTEQEESRPVRMRYISGAFPASIDFSRRAGQVVLCGDHKQRDRL